MLVEELLMAEGNEEIGKEDADVAGGRETGLAAMRVAVIVECVSGRALETPVQIL